MYKNFAETLTLLRKIAILKNEKGKFYFLILDFVPKTKEFSHLLDAKNDKKTKLRCRVNIYILSVIRYYSKDLGHLFPT